ncbi:MAG: extracellular solute-binding protein [Candidatus Pacebacteria bacterium]|nr:extracellular solute-binding protein [Candidatus Paceibacterota bacterium]MCF7862988.1 extracellular solute-binding protein [Candidatus Paceibacterota bacterium]
MKNFQIILITVFIVLAVVGVLVFSGMIPLGEKKNEEGSGGTVVLWGTVSSSSLSKAIENFNHDNNVYVLQYVQKREDSFDKDLLEALASGKGPDIFIVPENLIYKYSNKILPIPYESFPLASFQQIFISPSEVFLTSKGALAFPLSVDPLMMYYNRAFLNSSNIINPPSTWKELSEMVPVLNFKDESGKLIKTTVALGHFSNIENAKYILTGMFMQVGTPIVVENNGVFLPNLVSSLNSSNNENVLNTYTSFADPFKENYSWNKSMPNSKDAFTSGSTAFYFGFASELKSLIERNPNLNLMVAPMPQMDNLQNKITSGEINGLAVSVFSQNRDSAFLVANLLSKSDFAKEFASATGTIPIRKDLLISDKSNQFETAFYTSALFTRGWIDPSPKESYAIFKDVIEGILSNTLNLSSVIREIDSKLNLLFDKNI